MKALFALIVANSYGLAYAVSSRSTSIIALFEHCPAHTPHISVQFKEALKQLQLFLQDFLQLQEMRVKTSSGAGGWLEWIGKSVPF